jgi:hypothetical protein
LEVGPELCSFLDAGNDDRHLAVLRHGQSCARQIPLGHRVGGGSIDLGTRLGYDCILGLRSPRSSPLHRSTEPSRSNPHTLVLLSQPPPMDRVRGLFTKRAFAVAVKAMNICYL